MAKDFRELLQEASRHEQFGRFFKDVQVGLKVLISYQASDAHSCAPAETLDDLYAYTQWEVTLKQINKPITVPKIGAWDYLKHNTWAKKFDQPEYQTCVLGEFLTVEECQNILEDVIEYAMSHGQMESEDEIKVLDPDTNVKKIGGCGGCAGKKSAKAVAAE